MVSVSGIVSGIDTKAIINALVSAQTQPINRMKRAKAGLSIKVSKIGGIKSKMTALETLAKTFKDVEGVLKYTANSSSESVLTVTSDGTASPGSYNLDVTQVATAEKDRSVAFSGGAFDEVTAGTVTIALDDGTSADITVAEGETLTDVKNKINAADLDVDASIINDGTNAYLQVVARNTGHTIGESASNAITITEVYTGGTGTELGMTEITAATNSTFTIDSGISVEKKTNTVSDVLEGVTLELKTTGTSTLSVAADKTETKATIQTFVDAFNDVLGLIVPELRTTAETDPLTSLGGDFLIRKIQSDISSVVSERIDGMSSTYKSLAEIGIETGADGLLTIDSKKMEAALSGDIVAVGNLFAEDSIGVAQQVVDLVGAYTDTTDGLLKVRTDSLNDRIDDIDDNIFKQQDRVESLRERLQKQFTAMEQAMSQINAQGGALAGLMSQNTGK
jgi:flagellar hook-associated protein 2